MKTFMVLMMGICLVAPVGAFAGDESLPSKVDFTGAILPSSSMMIGEISKTAEPGKLVSKLSDAAPAANFGFTTGVSEEKGSFCLGVVMADLKLALQAKDAARTGTAVKAASAELVRLGAPLPLISAMAYLDSAVKAGIEFDAINRVSLPILEPFIEDFVQREGKMTFYRLGEWTESTRLAVIAGEQGKVELAAGFIKDINPADYFLKELADKGLPKEAVASLKALSQLGAKQTIGQGEIKSALNAVNGIMSAMGLKTT